MRAKTLLITVLSVLVAGLIVSQLRLNARIAELERGVASSSDIMNAFSDSVGSLQTDLAYLERELGRIEARPDNRVVAMAEQERPDTSRVITQPPPSYAPPVTSYQRPRPRGELPDDEEGEFGKHGAGQSD